MNIDNQILNLISKGEQKAFADLYNEFSSRVFNVALSYTQLHDVAEDIAQEVFVKVFNSAHKFRGGSSVYTWIYRITVNTSLNHVKKSRQNLLLGQDLSHVVDFEHPGIIAENKEKSQLLYAAMKDLIPSQKMAFVLSYIEDLPRKDVASIMEISLKAVESLLQRAKKNMRLKLEKHYPERRKS